jgi:transcription initiation factor TFIIH subunit 2
MPESDDEYVQPLSDEDAEAHVVSRSGKTRSAGRGGASHRRNDSGAGDDAGAAGGFELSRTWENVVEGEDGTIAGAIEGILEGGKRRR